MGERRILFILKRSSYTFTSSSGYNVFKSGLINSVRFCVEELLAEGIQAKFVVVTDNNDIDREVALYAPTDVIVEALWVVPEKFAVLRRLHPLVRWIVRLHSEIPFLAHEGIATEWIAAYLRQGVFVAGNSLRLISDLRAAFPEGRDLGLLMYLPNCYTDFPEHFQRHTGDAQVVNVGCFGAIRPMKNQLLQAVAAIRFATRVDRRLRFHINAERIELSGGPVLKNLINLFDSLDPARFKLVMHPWLDRADWLELLHRIDVGMQASFTETFNIVTADMVARGVPVVVSPEVHWVLPLFQASPTSSKAMAHAMEVAWRFRWVGLQVLNKVRLRHFARRAAQVWRAQFNG